MTNRVREIVRSDIFYPTGNWSIRKGELALHRDLGWKRYHEAMPADGSYFKTQEEATSFFEWLEKQAHCELKWPYCSVG